MTIDRIIAAIQRSTHFKRRELARAYPELMAIRWEVELETVRWEVASRKHEILGRCPLGDRQFAPCPPARHAEVPTATP
jgi:hypothetical protein